MPRQPRLVVAEYPHHIVLRGNNRSIVFYDDEDKRFFIECLKEAKKKTKSKIYAYCFMSNHVHLLIEPQIENGLGNMIQSLGRRYVQYINKKHKRTGTLWEGRFKSSLVSKDEYLLACSRYIELNPVRANIVKHPKDYPWSSYNYKAEGREDVLLDEDPIYKGLGKTSRERQMSYRAWIGENISDGQLSAIRDSTQRGSIFSNKKFFEEIAKLLGRGIGIRARGRPKKSL